MKRKKISYLLATTLIVASLAGCSSNSTTYSATVKGHNDDVMVEVSLDGDKITKVEVTSHKESEGISDKAISDIPKAIVEQQSLNVDTISGCTVSSTAVIEGTKKALTDAGIDISKYEKASTNSGSNEAEFSLEWDAQPQLGIIKGDYYKVEERFRQGHLGTLEVVQNDGKLVEVEFNELTRPNYYKRYYQNVSKRLSEYNFDMGASKGAAWIQSVVSVEQQMLDKQSLTGEFDVVSGASNSIEQSMLPLAEKLNATLGTPTGEKYYSIAEELGGGLTGKLKVIVKDGQILECRYDEIFANSQDDIEDPKYKKHYRTSKYESVEYHEPSRIGFNIQMDALNDKVVETQDLFDLTGLPATEATGDYKSAGYTERNSAWDNYLKLAEKLSAEMKADGVL